jgi:hypothetical protein
MNNNAMLGKVTVYKDVKNMICKGFLSLLIFFCFIFTVQSFLFYKYIKLKNKTEEQKNSKKEKKICEPNKQNNNNNKNKHIEHFNTSKKRKVPNNQNKQKIRNKIVRPQKSYMPWERGSIELIKPFY